MAVIYAYRNFKGKRKDGVTVYGIIPQFDGSTFAGSNCGAASEAMRVVSQQKGVRPAKGSPWQPTGRGIRTATGDNSGGLMPSQTTAASYKIYGVPHATPRIDVWTNVINKLKSGYSVDLLVRYGPIDDYKSGSPGFRGNHRGVLVGIDTAASKALWADPLYDGRRSGIPLGPRWIPLSVLKRAAGLLDLGNGTTINEKYGAGYAFYIPSLTRMSVVTKKYRASVPPDTKFGVYTITNGLITRRTLSHTGGFSATCSAPTSYRTATNAPSPPQGTYKLVKLLDGSRKGQYINAKYAKEV